MIPSNISREHVVRAIQYIVQHGVPKARESKRFRLVVDGKSFPPKYVVSIANKYANMVELGPAEFNGGQETNSFLERHGFTIERGSCLTTSSVCEVTKSLASDEVRSESGARRQKQALRRLLEARFGEVQTEASFDWLVVPRSDSMDVAILPIAEALASYRGYREYFSPGKELRVDLFVPSQKLIIEYDERQHFTIPRAIALENYPGSLELAFDLVAWISSCKATRATDPTPHYRDEQRAFYDSLRDILASTHGYTVIRVKDKEYDWTLPEAVSKLDELMGKLTARHAPSGTTPEEEATMAGRVGVTTRVVSVCVLGQPVGNLSANAGRQDLLRKAIYAIGNRAWSDIHAVLLPGGFFCCDSHIGAMPYAERARAIEQTSFHETCIESCRHLSESSNGTIIAVGVDGAHQAGNPSCFSPDQLCVAWSARGIAGIARKVFPTSTESPHYLCYAQDYRESNRVVLLANGARAILCACYDMFGCSEDPKKSIVTDRTRCIRHIHDGKELHSANIPPRPGSRFSSFRAMRTECISDLRTLLITDGVAIALGAIHLDPSARYWQIHGIQACSAGLDGGLSLGAAHFSRRLPKPHKHLLSAYGIPREYLTIGRKNSRRITPRLYSDWAIEDGLLIRLFETDPMQIT